MYEMWLVPVWWKKKKKRKTSFFFGFKVCQVIFHKMQNVSMVCDAFMMMEPGING